LYLPELCEEQKLGGKNMKKISALLLTVAMAMTMTLATAPAVYADTYATVTVTGVQNANYAQEVLRLVNRKRAAQGLQPLVMDSELQSAAMERAREIAVYYGQTRPDGSSFSTISAKTAAENINNTRTNAEGAVDAWSNLTGYKENLFSDSYKSVGIGCFKGKLGYCWTMEFGYDAGDGTAASGEENVTMPVNVSLTMVKPEYSSTTGSRISLSDADGIRPQIVWAYGTPYSLDRSLFNYSSSNEKIFTVMNNGRILPQGIGKAVFTATLKTDPSVTVSKTITIYNGRPPRVNLYKVQQATKSSVKMYWKELSCSGYQISYSKYSSDASGKTVTVRGGGMLQQTIYGLSGSTRCFVKVRAYNLVGGERQYGPYSDIYAVFMDR